MKNKFPEMDNYTSIIKLVPEAYGFINVTALVAKNKSTAAYRLNRIMEYKVSFSQLRDRMFAGLMGMYHKVFDLLQDKKLNTGPLKNYYAVAIESGNDIQHRVLSFDMYLMQANNFAELIQMPEFMNLPGIDDKSKHTAIFAFGYQYENDINAIDICNKVFHIKAFKQVTNIIKAYTFDSSSELNEFDTDDENCQKFIDSVFNRVDREVFDIGLTVEDFEHDHVNYKSITESASESTSVEVTSEVNDTNTESTQEEVDTNVE